MTNSNLKTSIIILFTITIAIGSTAITYLQMAHGDSMNLSNGSSPQLGNRTATLIIIKNVTYPPVNESDSSQQHLAAFVSLFSANDFIMHVNGNNPSPFEFAGSQSGTNVSIGHGPYAVTETKPQFSVLGTTSIISSNYSKDCTGTIKDKEIKTCKVSDTIYPTS